MPYVNPATLEVVLSLLQENATLEQVRGFLRERGLHHSAGSWDDMAEQRLLPAIKQGKLTISDLVSLLASAEEHGKQHVFLYRCSRSEAAKLLAEKRVRSALEELGEVDLLEAPRVLDKPGEPTLVDVRWEEESKSEALVVKVVERRTYYDYLGEDTEGEIIVKRWKPITVRAVNLFKLHPDGILELRVYSHRSASNYQDDVKSMWSLAGSLLPRERFHVVPLTKAKTSLWEQRKKLKDKVRFSDSSMRDAAGSVLSAATGSIQDDLFGDEAVDKSLDVFMSHDAYCDRSNIWFLSGKDGVPSKDVHVLLSGMENEFAVTAQCSKEDYEYVLDQLKRLNK